MHPRPPSTSFQRHDHALLILWSPTIGLANVPASRAHAGAGSVCRLPFCLCHLTSGPCPSGLLLLSRPVHGTLPSRESQFWGLQAAVGTGKGRLKVPAFDPIGRKLRGPDTHWGGLDLSAPLSFILHPSF